MYLGCRHCPYHHVNIPLSRRPASIKQPAWLWHTTSSKQPKNSSRDLLPSAFGRMKKTHRQELDVKDQKSDPAAVAVDVVYWEGTLSGYMAVQALREQVNTQWNEMEVDQKKTSKSLVFMVPFEAESRQLFSSDDDLSLPDVVQQISSLAERLSHSNQTELEILGLIGLPLHRGKSYGETVREGLELVQQAVLRVQRDNLETNESQAKEVLKTLKIEALCFTETYLGSYRRWRENELNCKTITHKDPHNHMKVIAPLNLSWPLWGLPQAALTRKVQSLEELNIVPPKVVQI